MRISSSRMAQMLENTGAAALQLTPEELAELNSAEPAIKVRCSAS
jgi:aryl-alcohol dehydrogenase-like predicted oxidoreductase